MIFARYRAAVEMIAGSKQGRIDCCKGLVKAAAGHAHRFQHRLFHISRIEFVRHVGYDLLGDHGTSAGIDRMKTWLGHGPDSWVVGRWFAVKDLFEVWKSRSAWV